MADRPGGVTSNVAALEDEYRNDKRFVTSERTKQTLKAAPHFIAGMHPAKKHDSEKNRMDLIPTSLLREVGAVLTHGAGKYGDRNWEKGLDWHRPYGAVMRHISAWWEGEDTDPESGLNHLAHAACELSFLIEYQAKGTGRDNRPSRVASGAGDTSTRLHDVPRSERDKPIPESLLERTQRLDGKEATKSSQVQTKVDCTDSSWTADTDWIDNHSWGV